MIEKFKALFQIDQVFYSFVVILVGLASFGLGRLSVVENSSMGVGKQVAQFQTSLVEVTEMPGVENPTAIYAREGENQVLSTLTGAQLNNHESVVASKTGSRYHLPTCPGAKQIKPQNLITFPSREAAIAAGYTAAANCPGL